MTPEALEFVRLTSVQTVKGWEDRAQLQEFRRALLVTLHCHVMNATGSNNRWLDHSASSTGSHPCSRIYMDHVRRF